MVIWCIRYSIVACRSVSLTSVNAVLVYWRNIQSCRWTTLVNFFKHAIHLSRMYQLPASMPRNNLSPTASDWFRCASVLLFSKLNKIFFGYFDPEKIFLGNKSKFFQGELDDSWEFDDSAAATATSSRAASSFITQSNAAFFAASSADLQSCRVALRAAWPQVVLPDNPSSPATSHAAANFFPETSAGAWSCTTLPDDRSSRVPSHAAEPCSD